MVTRYCGRLKTMTVVPTLKCVCFTKKLWNIWIFGWSNSMKLWKLSKIRVDRLGFCHPTGKAHWGFSRFTRSSPDPTQPWWRTNPRILGFDKFQFPAWELSKETSTCLRSFLPIHFETSFCYVSQHSKAGAGVGQQYRAAADIIQWIFYNHCCCMMESLI